MRVAPTSQDALALADRRPHRGDMASPPRGSICHGVTGEEEATSYAPRIALSLRDTTRPCPALVTRRGPLLDRGGQPFPRGDPDTADTVTCTLPPLHRVVETDAS